MARYVIFETYLAANWKAIQAGQEVTVEVQSKEDATPHLVKARIAQSGEELPGGEDLQVRNDDGMLLNKKLMIKILEELDPDEVEYKPLPSTAKPIY